MIDVREMKFEDIKRVEEVEASAIKGFPGYIKDAFDYYKSTKGELTVALIDDQIVGVGKISILFDGSAWLEALRVHEDYQKQGVGKAIYKRYFEQVNQYDCPHVSLYTGRRNIGSQTLARNNHLEMESFYESYTASALPQNHTLPFQIVNKVPDHTFHIQHFNINHTFYRNNEATLRGFLSQGYIYQYKDTILIMGSRFQPKRALYIAYVKGNYEKEAIAFALNTAYTKGVDRVVIHYPSSSSRDEDMLKSFGFVKDDGEDIVMTYIRKQ